MGVKKNNGLLRRISCGVLGLLLSFSVVGAAAEGTVSGNPGAAGRFYTDYTNIDVARSVGEKLNIQVAGEGFVLLKNHLVMGSISAITQCVLNGLGIAVLPEFAVERQLRAGELCAINVPLSPEHITSVCSRHKNKWLSPAMRLFMQLVRERML